MPRLNKLLIKNRVKKNKITLYCDGVRTRNLYDSIHYATDSPSDLYVQMTFLDVIGKYYCKIMLQEST